MSFKALKWLGIEDAVESIENALEGSESREQVERVEWTPEQKKTWKDRLKVEASAQREELRRKLEREGRFDLSGKLRGCGCPVPLICAHCGEGKVVESRCKKRWCPACAYAIQAERVRRYGRAIERMRWPMFLTLTAPNSPEVESVREIRKAWGKMRRRKMIAEKVAGGVASIEVTNQGNGWHPHLHAVIECEWLALHVPPPKWNDSEDVKRQKYDMAKMELSSLWGSCLGLESAIVLAKRVRDKGAAAYLLKYATKGSELIECEEEIGGLIDVIGKTKLVTAFGNLHGKMGELKDEERADCQCTHCLQVKSFVPAAVLDYMTRKDPAQLMGPVHFGKEFYERKAR